jgi:hypothetical protein
MATSIKLPDLTIRVRAPRSHQRFVAHSRSVQGTDAELEIHTRRPEPVFNPP